MSEGKTFVGGSRTKQSMFEILEKCKSAKQLLDHHRGCTASNRSWKIFAGILLLWLMLPTVDDGLVVLLVPIHSLECLVEIAPLTVN